MALAENTALGPLPDTAFGRVCEGFSRAVKYLPAEAGRKLGELLNPKTVFAFVAILALLAGVSLVPIVGPAVDYMVGAYGAVKLGQEFFALFGSVREASEATTTQALEVAAQHIARDLNDAVIDSMLFVAGTAGFRKLRSLLEPLASRFMPASFQRAPGIAESVEWAKALVALDTLEVDPEVVADTAGILFKQREDVAALTRDFAAELLKPEPADA